MFITRKHLSRRTMLRGAGVAMALPFLDSMVPAQTPLGQTAAQPLSRFAGILLPHGSSGSCPIGIEKHLHSPKIVGRNYDITPILSPMEAYKDYMTVLTGIDYTNVMPWAPEESGADHARSASGFLNGAHPKRTEGADIRAGITLDQLYAKQFGQDTPLPSIQLCIEDVGSLTGACGHGYSCVYANTMTWSSDTTPLPMEMNPRVAFERLFGDGANVKQRSERTKSNHSILDSIVTEVTSLQKGLDPSDRGRLNQYLEDVREIERRIQKTEAQNANPDRSLPDAPLGVPDSFDEHARIMYDLQWLAFMTETTRVSAYMMGRDTSARVFPESGIKSPFHGASHHGENPERIMEYAKINEYHVKLLSYFVQKLKDTPDGDGNLLDHTLIVYGSGMGNANVHAHLNSPLLLVGKGGGRFEGGVHKKFNGEYTTKAEGVKASNMLVGVANKLGIKVDKMGDSDGILEL